MTKEHSISTNCKKKSCTKPPPRKLLDTLLMMPVSSLPKGKESKQVYQMHFQSMIAELGILDCHKNRLASHLQDVTSQPNLFLAITYENFQLGKEGRIAQRTHLSTFNHRTSHIPAWPMKLTNKCILKYSSAFDQLDYLHIIKEASHYFTQNAITDYFLL